MFQTIPNKLLNFVPATNGVASAEIFLIPLCVVTFSIVVASLMFSFAFMVIDGAGPNSIKQYFISALFPAIVFIIGT